MMTNVPKVVLCLLGLFTVNAALVVGSVIDRFVGQTAAESAADPTDESLSATATVGGTPGGMDDEGLRPSTAADEAKVTSPSAAEALLESIPVPEDLPAVPSLQPPDNDPQFEKFRELAAEQFPEMFSQSDLPAELPARRPTASELSTNFYPLLEQRLTTTAQLTAATVHLAQEARRHAQNGDLDRAHRFLQRITQLRELAAELLIEEL